MRSEAAANALVLAGSAALLGGALLFQYVGGYAPCVMCVWQRWPHVAALGLGLVAWALRSRALIALAAVAVLVSAGLGMFHAGVELGWWEGVTACSGSVARGSSADVLASIIATPLVRCDAVAWSLFGLSMAGWNAVLSAGIGGGALWLLKRR